MPPGSEGAPDLGVQGLNCIRGVDDPPDALWEGKERDDLAPVPPSALSGRRIVPTPGTSIEVF